MELRELNTFVTIVQLGNFSKAAEQLGYTQSAVTVQIKNIEKELNTKLFDRIGKQTTLTNQGHIFYKYSIDILNKVMETKEALLTDDNLNGSLSMGLIDSLCTPFFSNILNEYHKLYPNVKLSVLTDTPNFLLNKLHNNSLDFVYLLDENIYGNNFEKIFEIDEEVVFTCSSQHKLAKEDNISLDKISNFPLILTEPNASYRKILESKLSFIKKSVTPFMETTNTNLICQMLFNNKEISFLPKFLIDSYLKNGQLVILNVPEISVNVSRQVIYHKNKWVTREMKAFFNLLQQYQDHN